MSADPRRRGLPGGLLGAIGLAVAFELWLGAIDPVLLSNGASLSWRHGGKAARSARAVGSEVLFFGDSQVQFSSLPRVIQGRTGRRSYNLALYAASPPASYYQLRHALDAGARPRALVVDFQPNTLSMSPAGQVRLWPEFLTLADAAELAWSARDADLLAAVATCRLLRSARSRHEIRTNLRKALAGESPLRSGRYWMGQLPRNWRFNRGANVLPASPAPPDAVAPDMLWLTPEGWKPPDPAVIAHIDKFLDLAAARGIPVVWVMPPTHPAVRAWPDPGGRRDGYVAWVRQVQGRYPNIHVLDARDCGYGRPVFADLAHLDRRGAQTFSVEVADELERLLGAAGGGPRWRTLRPFRDHPAVAPVEDTDQSRIALKIEP